jgi:chemotaxis protein histidine kinase CheA
MADADFEKEVLSDFLMNAEESINSLGEHHDDLLAGRISDEAIGALFRTIHSLKGAAPMLNASLSQKDARLETLGRYCHKFEDFLDLLRKKRLTLTPQIGALIVKGIDAVSHDVEQLKGNGAVTLHEDLLAQFSQSSNTSASIVENDFVKAETRADFLFFTVKQDIGAWNADSFASVLMAAVDKIGEKNVKIIVDLKNEYLLSTSAWGAVIGYAGDAKIVLFLRPSPTIRNNLKRFQKLEMVCETFEECLRKGGTR